MRHWFKSPVSIWVGVGRQRNVTSVEEAARLLLEEWPDVDNRAAREAMLAALEGGSIDVAAEAFREAASEAGILVKK